MFCRTFRRIILGMMILFVDLSQNCSHRSDLYDTPAEQDVLQFSSWVYAVEREEDDEPEVEICQDNAERFCDVLAVFNTCWGSEGVAYVCPVTCKACEYFGYLKGNSIYKSTVLCRNNPPPFGRRYFFQNR